MPNRLLKEGICTSDAINMLSSDSEVLFYRLLVTADDYGRMDGRVQIVKSQCFPLKDSFTSDKIKELLAELRDAGLISFYQVSNKPFFYVRKWEQRVRSKGKYPEPPVETNEGDTPTHDSEVLTDDSEVITHDSNPLTDDSEVLTSDGLGLGLGLGLGKGRGKGKGKEETHTAGNSEDKQIPTPAASVCLEIKKIGIIDINPSHPELLKLIEIGAAVDEFVHAARTAKDKGKGFSYVLGIVKGQRKEALEMSGKVLHGKIPNKQEALEQRNSTVAQEWVPPEMRKAK